MATIIKGKTTIGRQQISKYYIGGDFTIFNGTNAYRIARLNYDGSLDTSFDTTNGFDGRVLTIALDTITNKIYVGGNFTSYNGTNVYRIARLNYDGSLDTSFNTSGGFNGSVNTIAVDSSGKVYIGGTFTNYDGTYYTNIVRLNRDGIYDDTFPTGSGFDNYVTQIVIQPDNTLIVVGDFTTYDISYTAPFIAKLRNDASIVTSYPQYSSSGLDGTAYSLKLQSDGKLLVGGSFTHYDGASHASLVRFNQDGTIDSTFNNLGGFNAEVFSIDYNGKIIAGGYFDQYNSITSQLLIKLNQDSSIATSYGTKLGGAPIYSVLFDKSKILAGGYITDYDGISYNNIIRLNDDATIDSSFNVGSGPNDYVRTIIKFEI